MEISTIPEAINPEVKRAKSWFFSREARERRCWRALDRQYIDLPTGVSSNQRVSIEKGHKVGYIEIWTPDKNLQGESNRLQQIDIEHNGDGTIYEVHQTLTIHDRNGFPRVEVAHSKRGGEDNSLSPSEVLWTLRFAEGMFEPSLLSGKYSS